jgi:hypothetical protein
MSPRFDTLTTKAALAELPGFRHCISPACTSGQIHFEGADAPIFRCEACGFKACVLHNTAWHEDETCAQYDERNYAARKALLEKEEKASLKAVERIAKKCPGCKRPIQKNGGCSHMSCKIRVPCFEYGCRLTTYRRNLSTRVLLSLLGRLQKNQSKGQFCT